MYSKNESDIKEIKEWLLTQRFLPKHLSESFIYTFLLGCEGDKERTKTILSNYFSARQSIPEFFTERDPLLEENISVWKTSCFVPLKGLQDGCRVFLGTALESRNYDFAKFVKQMFMCFDLLIQKNQWKNGNRMVILSYDKIREENLATYTIYISRKTVECERDKYLPGKLKAIHNVHIPPFMKKIHARFKPYLTQEDEKHLFFHKNLKGLHKYINPDILPLEFGGKAGPLQNIIEKWCTILKEHRSFFLHEEKKRMQEVTESDSMTKIQHRSYRYTSIVLEKQQRSVLSNHFQSHSSWRTRTFFCANTLAFLKKNKAIISLDNGPKLYNVEKVLTQ